MTTAHEDGHPESNDELWERPYTVTGGRTRPTTQLDLMSLVRATGKSRVAPERLGREHALALRLCRAPTSVAEVAAHLRQPVMVAKVLLSDLIEFGAVTARFPAMFDPPDPTQLKALVDALRKL